MSEFIYYIYYRPGFKICKPDAVSKHLGKEKSEINTHFFDKEELLDSENNDVGKGE